MREVTQKVYSIKELDTKAKEAALNKLREFNCSDDSYVAEDWKEVLILLGFEEPTLSYVVSYSQGDGASFTSPRWSYPTGLVETIARTYPKDKYLNELALRISKMFKGCAYKGLFTVSANRTGYSNYTIGSLEVHEYSPLAPTDRVILDAKHIINCICHKIYKDLCIELDYQNSEEYLVDFAEANDYEFLSNGSIYQESK